MRRRTQYWRFLFATLDSNKVIHNEEVQGVSNGCIMVRMHALRKEKLTAIRMRKEGASYSQIREKLKVSKSSLSLWLRNMPLSKKRLGELQGFNAVRIEKYRETRRRTREDRWAKVRETAKKDIGPLSKRELFLAGLFLYWGEGGKTKAAATTISNTDPAVILFFMRWLKLFKVPRDRLRIHVHLYADMNVQKELEYWSKTLKLPLSSFRKPYIKKSNRAGLTYMQKFTHGTCNLIYENRDVSEYVLQSLDYIRSTFATRKGV